jgi:ketosteroid isomerase-like protein
MSTLSELDAEVAVRAVMAAYMAACDAHDADRVADLFEPDGRLESPGPDGTTVLRGREAIHRSYAFDCARLTFCVHFLTNERIVTDGDRAYGRWSYFEPATNRASLAVWTGGRYDNEFARGGGTWRFSVFRVRGVLAAPFDRGWVPDPKIKLT